jgi:hypothetical protein
MICRKPHVASSICLRATIFQNPNETLWTSCIFLFHGAPTSTTLHQGSRRSWIRDVVMTVSAVSLFNFLKNGKHLLSKNSILNKFFNALIYKEKTNLINLAGFYFSKCNWRGHNITSQKTAILSQHCEHFKSHLQMERTQHYNPEDSTPQSAL